MSNHSQEDELDKILDRTSWGDYEYEDGKWSVGVTNKPVLKKAIKAYASTQRQVTGDTSDGYHTFNELYDFRKAYNALLFNEWASQLKYSVHKSWKHSDGELCFGGGWFVVVAETPEGQITNHYEEKDWDLFQVPEIPLASKWDGHTAQEALQRLLKLAQSTNQSPQEGDQ